MARRRALRPVILAAAVALLAAGCATVPTVGQPQAVTGATGQQPQAVQPIPPVPGANWDPQQIVLGFLSASASFTGGHAAAQKFLTPTARRTFHLGSWAVTVVNSAPTNLKVPFGPVTKAQTGIAKVTLEAQQVATISDIGQYVYDPAARSYTFALARINGQWRINSLTPPALLLTQDSFTDVYQPRNLYFWAPDYTSLVPEPVFAPQQDTYAAAAANLVNALLRTNQDEVAQDPTWLASATRTSFPAGATLIGDKVAIAGQTATVDLGGAAGRASPQQLRYMAEQLVTTLTSTSYSSPAIARHVELKINGRDRVSAGLPGPYMSVLPGSAGSSGAAMYYLAQNGTVSELNGLASTVIRNPPGHSQLPFTQIAVTQAQDGPQQLAGAVASGAGCGIYHGPLTGSAALTLTALPAGAGACSSVSWDSRGNLWAVTAAGIWILPAGGGQFLPVTPPLLPGGSTTPYRVLSVRVAPDAVRVAMLVQARPAGLQFVMAAVTRTDGGYQLGPTVAVGPTLTTKTSTTPALTGPVALSWLDPDHLVVLARSALYSVPVNGGAPAYIESAPDGADSVTATGPGRITVTGGGLIWTTTGAQQALMQIPPKGASATPPQ